MKKSWMWIIGIVLVVAIIAGLYYYSQPKGDIKIGYIGPLTGDAGSIGQGQQRVLQMAVAEINQNGGVNGRKIEIIFEDGKCDATEAVTAAQKLINIDQVKYIIGGQCSSETIAVAPVAEASKVLLLSPLSSNPSITNLGDYIFRNYPSDSYQGKVAAQYAYNTLKAKDVAVLSCLADWCVGLKDSFSQEFKSLGGNIVELQEFEKDSIDLKTQLLKISAKKPALIYMPSYAQSTIAALKQAKEIGLNTSFLGGDAWEDSTIWSNTKGFNEGDMYVVPKTLEPSTEFKNNYIKLYGNNSDIVLAALQNYDALYILKQAIKSVGDDSTKVKDYLYSMPTYSGLSGNIKFDQNGDLVGAEYNIKKVISGVPTIIQ